MAYSDPLFQHSLVRVVREHCPDMYGQTSASASDATSELSWKGMPVIFDEVFTGLYRLGRFSSSSFLDAQPDISVHAKLLTGGLLPLCTTLASESIFEAFLSPEKSDALLHGHSYTAHAVGCEIAQFSLKTMMDMDKQGIWSAYKDDWKAGSEISVDVSSDMWSMWSKDFVRGLSFHENVESVFALGSVLAVSLKDPSGSGMLLSVSSRKILLTSTVGYTSTAATGLRDKMLQGTGSADNVIHSRVLGNVLYLMASMTTTRETLSGVEKIVQEAMM